MNINQMLEQHIVTGADLTVAAKPVNLEEARGFGVIGVDGGWRMRSWAEGTQNSLAHARRPRQSLGLDGQLHF